MPSRRQDLETRLIATDKASKVIEGVSDELDKLDKRETDITVGVDDKATDDIKELDRRLDGLSKDDKKIVVQAQAKDAQRDVDRLLRSLGHIDKMDDTEVQLRLEGLAKARSDLDKLERQVDELDREEVEIPVDVDNRTESKFARLKTDLGNATGGLSKFKVLGSTAFSTLSTYGPQALATAGVAVTAFVTKAVTDFQTLALEVGKMRDTLGIPAEEASRLKEVAEDVGVPIGTLTTAISKMNRTAATTPAIFQNIGANIVKSDDGATDVMATFLDVIDTLNAIPDAAARAAAGQQIFGKGWGAISELIVKGADDVRQSMDDVGEGKLVTDAQIAQARQLRDSVDGLRDRFEEFANTVGKEITPALIQAADVFGLLADTAGEAISILRGDFDIPVLDKLVRYGTPIVGQWNAITDAVAGARRELEDYAGVTHGSVGVILQQNQALSDTELAVSQAEAAIARQAEVTRDLYSSTEEGARNLELLKQAQEEATQAAEDHVAALEDEAEAALEMSGGMQSLADINRDLADASREQAKLAKEETATASDRVDAALRIAELQVKQFEAMKQAAGATATATEKLDAQNKALLDQAQTLKGPARTQLLDYIADLNGIPTDKLTNITTLLDQGKFEEAERKIKRLSENREATVIYDADTTEADAARDRLSQDITTDMIIQPRVGDIIRREAGGTVPRTAAVLVGETGPEIVGLPGGSRVYSSSQTHQMLVGAGNQRPVIINTTLQAAVIGAPFDVANAVDDANRRIARLLPKTP